MNIYITMSGVETGPFTWGEVFVRLNCGELSLDDLGRMDLGEEVRPLSEFHLWGEGDEVGPFTWDDINVMLREGVLDRDVEARFEEEEERSRLADVIERSREIEVVQREPAIGTAQGWRAVLALLFRGQHLTPKFQWVISICLVLLLVAGLFLFAGHRGQLERPLLALQTPPSEVVQADETITSPEQLAPEPVAPLGEPSTETAPIATDPSPMPAEAKPHPSEVVPAIAHAAIPEDSTSPSPEVVPREPATPQPAPVQSPKVVSAAKSATPTPKPASATSIEDFFKIESIKLVRKAPRDGIGVWTVPVVDEKPGEPIFHPSLEVKVSTRENTRSDKTFAKAYFYDANNKIVSTLKEPSKAGESRKSDFAAPVIFYKDKPDHLFFAIPATLEDAKWKALIVFGDKHEAQVISYPPTTSAFLLDYPEKGLVETKAASRLARRPAMDPLIEHVVKTKNPSMPQMTLFLRPPKGITDPAEVQGVLAICILANGVEDLRRDLQKEEMPGDYAGLFSFANKHKLAILAWGSRGLWDAGRNYDEFTREQAKALDQSFDLVANAWARGVSELGDKFGIPQKNFLLWGNCGSAQFAARLALRKPEYFLAVHVHMPGSYDKPTPEAAKVLWCLTIGELEGGYERSKKWVKAAREAGYPILYKAIPGLGHTGHPDAAALGFEFFEFAMLQKTKREQMEAELASQVILPTAASAREPWIEEFRNPAFYGDFVNQEIFPPSEIAMIPAGFRTPIPTKAMATIWGRSK